VMMNWGGGYYMMDSHWGTFGNLISIIVVIDLILLGVWLWKRINK
jgi:hypothetical protein